MIRPVSGWIFAGGVWVVLGWDCYAKDAKILDPTLWSYDKSVKGVWVGSMADGRHTPHGAGSIWDFGCPPDPKGPIIDLPDLNTSAKAFLKTINMNRERGVPHGLDHSGWWFLAHAPVQGWPAKDIIEAMYRHPKLKHIIPIDIVGMLTDLNPGKLYLREVDNAKANANSRSS